MSYQHNIHIFVPVTLNLDSCKICPHGTEFSVIIIISEFVYDLNKSGGDEVSLFFCYNL